jgi:hypothetical protein
MQMTQAALSHDAGVHTPIIQKPHDGRKGFLQEVTIGGGSAEGSVRGVGTARLYVANHAPAHSRALVPHGRAGWMMLATSGDAIQLKKRRFVEDEVAEGRYVEDEVTGNICQALGTCGE